MERGAPFRKTYRGNRYKNIILRHVNKNVYSISTTLVKFKVKNCNCPQLGIDVGGGVKRNGGQDNPIADQGPKFNWDLTI